MGFIFQTYKLSRCYLPSRTLNRRYSSPEQSRTRPMVAPWTNGCHDLSERELEGLELIADGLSNAEISRKLYISEKTTKSHVSNILGKLHLADRTQAAVYAWRQGVVRRDAPFFQPLVEGVFGVGEPHTCKRVPSGLRQAEGNDDRRGGQRYPYDDDEDGGHAVDGFAIGGGCSGAFAAIFEHVGRDHAYRQGDAEGNQDEVVQVAENGDGVGDQVYRAERVAHDDRREHSGVQRHPRVPIGEVQRVDLGFQAPRPAL